MWWRRSGMFSATPPSPLPFMQVAWLGFFLGPVAFGFGLHEPQKQWGFSWVGVTSFFFGATMQKVLISDGC